MTVPVDPRSGLEDWARLRAKSIADEYAMHLSVPRRSRNKPGRAPGGLQWASLCSADAPEATRFFEASAARNKLLNGSLKDVARDAFQARLRELAGEAV